MTIFFIVYAVVAAAASVGNAYLLSDQCGFPTLLNWVEGTVVSVCFLPVALISGAIGIAGIFEDIR